MIVYQSIIRMIDGIALHASHIDEDMANIPS
jgi:hypothetical protein